MSYVNKPGKGKGSHLKERAAFSATLLLLAVTLTACGSETDQRDDNSQTLQTPSASPTNNPNVVEPGEELTILDEASEPEESKPVPVPSTEKERESSKNPEKPKGSISENNSLPKGVQLPVSGDVLEEASRLDGYNSFVALSFDLPWESVVEELRTSLEASGWECYECIPFIPGPNAPKETERFRYFLNMEKDGHKLMTIIAVMVAGNVTASLTFQG